jgi:Ca-activated chloride channel homolog
MIAWLEPLGYHFRLEKKSMSPYHSKLEETCMKQLYQLLGTAILITLVACGGGKPTPNKASFNGVSQLDVATGKANLSISILKDETILTTGKLSNPTVTVNPVSTNLQAQQNYTASAATCGDIVSKGENVTAALTLDATGSMSQNDPEKLRAEAAKDFVKRMTGQDRAAIASFDTSTDPTPPYTDLTVWQEFSSDKALLESGIDKATLVAGGTNVWDAGIDSVTLLSGASGENKLLILLTDGEDNSSSKTSKDVITVANQNKINVYTIGLGTSINDDELLKISSSTGGTFNQVNEAPDLIGLYDSIFNASRASGCISVTFQPVPTPGAVLSGTLTFAADSTNLSTPYTVRFPN